MRIALGLVVALLVTAPAAMADSGLVTVRSAHTVAETLDRLEQAARDAGAVIAARIGTPLIQARQTFGVDLPLRALVWEDEQGQVWLTYNAPAYLAARHNVPVDVVEPIRQGLERLVERATRP